MFQNIRNFNNYWVYTVYFGFWCYNNTMKSKIHVCLYILHLFSAIIFSNCAKTRQYDFSLKNTLSIFMLNNGKDYYFCIPVQYMGDYQIKDFDFDSGYVLIGDYEIMLKKDEINIYAYLNETADELGSSIDNFNFVFSEENGKILISKMSEPLTNKNNSDEKMNHYYIFIEKRLNTDDMKRIINQYKKGNVYSKLYIKYDITIDNELQAGSGMYDDFELYNGLAINPDWFPENLNFFKAKYLKQGV